MLLVARALVHFVTVNVSRMSGPSIVKLFSTVVKEIVPLIVSHFIVVSVSQMMGVNHFLLDISSCYICLRITFLLFMVA